MALSILLLIIGLVILIKGAQYMVDGAVMVSEKLAISPLLIGITIVAFGTSAPELAVNVVSALAGADDVGLGNIIGSNVANIGLVLGITAVISPLMVKRTLAVREVPFMLLSVIVLLILAADRFFTGAAFNEVSVSDGYILLAFFSIFLYYLSGSALSRRSAGLAEEFEKEYAEKKRANLYKGIVFLIGGLAGILLGGKFVVDHAVVLARLIGISEILIGATIVAVGTSLPELTTSVVAAYKRVPDIAIGNVIGSNIFNTFLILGVNAVISPLTFQSALFIDVIAMFALTALLFLVSITAGQINRKEGALLLLMYVGYISYIVLRG